MLLRTTTRCLLQHRLYSCRAPTPRSQEHAALLDKYISTRPVPISLSQLLSFGRPLTEESIKKSVEYVLTEIPRRLAMRVRALESLPFIVGTNPYIVNTLNLYRNSFEHLLRYQAKEWTVSENEIFVQQLEQLVAKHANDIPTMAKGFQECIKYLSTEQINDFLDGAIRNRISIRLIAEQHITLTHALQDGRCGDDVGVVNKHCSPSDMVHICASFVAELCEATLGASPAVVIDGVESATFPYVPVHLEYMFTEILKNAFRATVEHHSSKSIIPPVQVTIAPTPEFLSIRVRDEGGGISPIHLKHIFSYAFTTAVTAGDDDGGGGGPYAAQHIGGSAAVGAGGEGQGNMFGGIMSRGLQTGIGTIAGLGYGLPMSRLYARYFGGSMELRSLEAYGSDVFLRLRCLNVDGTRDAAI